MKIKQIRWVDSHAFNNWDHPNEYKELAKNRKEIVTIGFVLEENDDYIVLVQSYGNDQVDNGIMVYKEAILTTKDI